MAAHHSNLLFFASVLALLAPLLAVGIENLERLKANLDEIVNLHSHGHHRGLLISLSVFPDAREDRANTRRSRASDPQRTERSSWPKDCSEVPPGSPNGIYVIHPTGLHPIVVYCEVNETDGGWTVIQRNRQSTEITWAESWSTYKYGFGNVHTDYWLGTEYIHQISKQKVYQVRFVIWDAANNASFADYNLFSLEDESHGYRLRLGTYSGLAGDAMTSNSASTVHDNMKFSAKDVDQDTYSGNCASSYGGGWWYSACYSVRLNVKGAITWGSLCDSNCKGSAILIKPASYC
ncbi:fibrinogen-like protein 1-like protein [Theristicus caerulescens]